MTDMVIDTYGLADRLRENVGHARDRSNSVDASNEAVLGNPDQSNIHKDAFVPPPCRYNNSSEVESLRC